MPDPVFPENEVEVMRDYFPAFLSSFQAQLSAVTVSTIPLTQTLPNGAQFPLPENQQAKAVNDARQQVLTALNIAASWESSLSGQGGVYEQVKNREFSRALSQLVNLPPKLNVRELTINILVTAQLSSPLDHWIWVPFAPPTGPKKVKLTLPGYKGPALDEAQLQHLFDLQELVKGGPESRFQEGMLRAECLFGQARFAGLSEEPDNLYKEAIAAYTSLREAPFLSDARKKFLAIRSGFARLARGDHLFRRSFRFNESNASERTAVSTIYAEAGQLMRASGISQENPLRNQIERHADAQGAKIGSGFNYLGYRDSYVPHLSMSTLVQLARGRIQSAMNTVTTFESYKSKADQLAKELEKLTDEALAIEFGLKIASERADNARDRQRRVHEQIARLDEKMASLESDLFAGVGKALFTMAALAASGVTGGTLALATVPGMVSAYTDYNSDDSELSHQKVLAGIESNIAARDVTIADLEVLIAKNQLAAAKRYIEASRLGRFNADRFFALANAYEDMSRRHVDVAFEWLYLLERAISFKRLKDVEEVTRNNIGRRDLLLDPADLDEKLLKLLEAEAIEGGKGQPSNEPEWSLRLRNPIEFSRFLQSGEAELNISLYDVEKLMNLKGFTNVRIKRVGVRVIGGESTGTGWSGTLSHRGIITFRDKDSLQDRFLPTDEQVSEAMKALESGTKDEARVGGIELRALDQDTLRITSEGEVTNQTSDYDLLPIENYSVTGLWFLRTQGLSSQLRNVADVRLKFGLSLNAFDQELEANLEKLIGNYENELADADALDEIRVYSLASSRFGDTFSQLESTGQGTFTLKESDFPPDITDLNVKTVIVQALDEDGNGLTGIEIEFSKPGTAFILTRTTVEMGFSEDVAAKEIPTFPQSDRPPIEGTWRIRLPKPEQFAQLGDLRMFFLHEYKAKA